MAQFASDSFAGVAGAELSASWTKRAVAAQKVILTAGGRARADGVNPIEYYWNAGNPATADYTVEADIYVASLDANVSSGVFGRGSTTNTECYSANYHVSNGWRLYKQVAGAFTQLGSSVPQTLTVGNTYRIKLEMIGTAIKVYADGVLKISVTDSAVTSAGKAGIRIYDNTSTPSDSKNLQLDNFSADDPVSGSTGTLAKTNANDTLAASGSSGSVTGTLAKTNANDTLAASGSTPVVGTLAKTNANDTCSAGSVILDMDLLSEPLYFAHAGNKAVWPEESDTAFAASVAAGENFLDIDAQASADGLMVLMHDTTIDRTTSGTGNVSSKTIAQWNALTLDPTSGGWFGGGYPDTEAPPVLSSVLSAYDSTALFSIEVKDSNISQLLSELSTAGTGLNQAVVSSFTSGHMSFINTSGYKSMFLTTSGAESAATVAGYGVDWVGVGTGTSSTRVGEYLAAGLKVAVWTLSNRAERDTWLGYGVNGIFSDDTKYIKATAALRTADNFSSQTWDHGMLASDGLLTAASRGQFFSSDYWGYSSNATGYAGCLMGYLCPVAAPSNFVLDFKVTFDSASGGDDTRWASVFIGVNDKPFTNGSGAESGYALLCRKNGEVSIWKKAPSGAAVSQQVTAGSTITAGSEKIFRVTVTTTDVKFAQIDSSGNDITAVTIPDATYRGGYLSFGRNGLATKFRDMSVSVGVSGTLAVTNSDDTIAASGSAGGSGYPTITGEANVALGTDSATISGTTTVVGTLAKTNANDSVSASGYSGAITGGVAYTNEADTCVARGTSGVVSVEVYSGGYISREEHAERRKKQRIKLGIIEDDSPKPVDSVSLSKNKEIKPKTQKKRVLVDTLRLEQENAELAYLLKLEAERQEEEEVQTILRMLMEL